jgi:hypothetical protein
MAACASPHPHRIELRVDTAEELRMVDDDFVALYAEAIEHMLDQASVVRQVAGPSTHGGIHCTDTERELLVVHTPGAVPRDIDRPSDYGQFSYAE